MWKWLYSWFESVLCLIGVHDYEIVATKEVEEFKYGENHRRTLCTRVCLRLNCQDIWDEIGDRARWENDRAQRLAQRREEALKKYEAVK